MKKISFVIPCYRSEHTLPHVIAEIDEKMGQMKAYEYDIFLVNDSSPDNTFGVIRKLCEERENIKGIGFAKNFGQHAALMAGLRFSDGDYVVCLDDDGQTPANEVDKLIDKLEEGFDAVYAKYEHKQHSVFRNLGSKVNELMTRMMLEKPADLYISSYFAVKRFVVEDMIRYENSYPYVIGLVLRATKNITNVVVNHREREEGTSGYTMKKLLGLWLNGENSYPYVIGLVLRATKNITNVVVNHREREEGTSGYTMKKLLGLWLNGFTAFSVKPLRIATAFGGVFAGLGFLYGIYTIIKRFVNPQVPMGFSSMMSAVVFFGGMIMVMLGLIGEYIGRIYISLNNSPQYVIREQYNIMGGINGRNSTDCEKAGEAVRKDASETERKGM